MRFSSAQRITTMKPSYVGINGRKRKFIEQQWRSLTVRSGLSCSSSASQLRLYPRQMEHLKLERRSLFAEEMCYFLQSGRSFLARLRTLYTILHTPSLTGSERRHTSPPLRSHTDPFLATGLTAPASPKCRQPNRKRGVDIEITPDSA